MTRQNATYLTLQHCGRDMEEKFWNPCIEAFLNQEHPELLVSHCVIPRIGTAPSYEPRGPNQTQEFIHPVHTFGRQDGEKFARLIALDILNGADVPRRSDKGDCFKIAPDFVMIGPGKNLCIIESKPFDGSILDGNQGAGEAYARFVQCINEFGKNIGISCQYLFIAPISVLYEEFKALQTALPGHFGIIFLEDIFQKMAETGFQYNGIKNWQKYSEKGDDYKK